MLWKQTFGKSGNSHSFQSGAHAHVLVEGLLSDKLRSFLLLFRAVTLGWMISLPDLQRRSHMDSVRNQLNFPKIYANHSHKANVPFQSLIQLRRPTDFISRKKTWPPSPLVAEKLAVADLLTMEKAWNEGDDSNALDFLGTLWHLAGLKVWTFHLQTLRCWN